jgi:large repetitive protein
MPVMRFIKYLIALLLLFVIAGMGNIAYAAKPVPRITSTSPLPDGVVTIPYSFTFEATSTQPPISNWVVRSGAVPPGLILDINSGVLSGTPTAAGTYTFGITCDDTQNPRRSAVTTFTLTIRLQSCSFVSGINTGAIAFSNIDPSSTGNLYATAVTQQVAFTCTTSPMAYTISVNPSSGWIMQSGANTMVYMLGVAASGTYSGAAVNLLIPSGVGGTSISQPDYQNAPSGVYTNNAVINITVSWILGGAGSINATIPIGNVSGSVINMCTISQSPGMLTFNLDPSVSGTTSATISPDMQIKCTRNAGITITASSACGGAAPMLANGYPPVCGADTIPYTFNFLSSITGQGFGGTGISLGLGGSAASANYATAPVGNYGDQQTLTITY